MSFVAHVYRVLIASPSDVYTERDTVTKVIQEWNDLYSFEKKVVLLPIRWETHSSPELGMRPQEIINRDVVDNCDLAIGVFWTRMGSPTGKFDSGTLEEIERVGNDGKMVMLYFSKAKVDIDTVDLEQYKKLKEFKTRTYPNGLVESYNDIVEFRDKLAKQLEIKIRMLIANKDGSKANTSDLTTSLAKLEMGVVENENNQELVRETKVQSTIIEFINLENVPDYPVKEKGSEHTLLSTPNVNYYREYLDYIKQQKKVKKYNFCLLNSGEIGIRDIFIELEIEKVKGLLLLDKAFQSPEKTIDNWLFSENNHLGRNDGDFKAKLVESDQYYLLQISLEALQPQRKLLIRPAFFIGAEKPLKLIGKVKMYADCFPQPLEENLVFNISVDKLKVDALASLKEIGEII